MLASTQKSWVSNVADGNVKCTATLKNSVIVSQGTKHTLMIHSAIISLLGIYPRNVKTYIHTKSCT